MLNERRDLAIFHINEVVSLHCLASLRFLVKQFLRFAYARGGKRISVSVCSKYWGKKSQLFLTTDTLTIHAEVLVLMMEV